MKLLVLAVLLITQMAAPSFPQAEISNGRLRATLYLPDKTSGYYRGTRFDWSGVIVSLTANGHEYFGPWFEQHDPLIHDGITGPVEEFLTGESGLGYDEAKPGERFVRIGVGAVKKPDEKAYRRFATYEIVDHGEWRIEKAADRISFVHLLTDTNGYAYIYRKIVSVKGDMLNIEHWLENTGKKKIVTTVYNHNFFTLDRQTTSSDIAVVFPFDPRPQRPLNDMAEVSGREIRFLKPFEPRQSVFTEIDGFGSSPGDYDFKLENRRTGAGVRISGGNPITKLYFWSATKTVCPEPYIDVSVEPGQTSMWATSYTFYEAAKTAK
jgi:hypothetical protein